MNEMKVSTLFVFAVLLAPGAAVLLEGCTAPGRSSDVVSVASNLNHNDKSVAGKDMSTTAFERDELDKANNVRVLMNAEDYSGALALLNQYWTDADYRSILAISKLEILCHLQSKPEAVDIALQIVHGDYSDQFVEPFLLRLPVDFAVELNRMADAYELSATVLERQSAEYSEYASLQTPVSEPDNTKRLAYTYMVFAVCRDTDLDVPGMVAYSQKARDLMPSSPVALIRLAAALGDRGLGTDRQQSKDLLTQAYNLAPVGSELRTAAQDFAHRYGLGNIP